MEVGGLYGKFLWDGKNKIRNAFLPYRNSFYTDYQLPYFQPSDLVYRRIRLREIHHIGHK